MFFTKIFMVLILLSVLVLPAKAAEVITGMVKDSLTGALLSSVKVKSNSPACSTTTNASGQFTLNIPLPTMILPSSRVSAGGERIVWNPDQGAFLFSGPLFEVEVKDASGAVVARFSSADRSAKKLPSGVYVATWSQFGSRGAFKLLNFPHSSQSFSLSEEAENVEAAVLAKSVASLYNLSFAKDGYDGAAVSAPSGANLDVKLVPKGAEANVQITRDSLGTLTIKVKY